MEFEECESPGSKTTRCHSKKRSSEQCVQSSLLRFSSLGLQGESTTGDAKKGSKEEGGKPLSHTSNARGPSTLVSFTGTAILLNAGFPMPSSNIRDGSSSTQHNGVQFLSGARLTKSATGTVAVATSTTIEGNKENG